VVWFEAGVTGKMVASHFTEDRYLPYFGAYTFAGELVPLLGEYTCCCGVIMERNWGRIISRTGLESGLGWIGMES